MWFKNELSAVFIICSAFTLLSSEKSVHFYNASLEKMPLFLDCFPSAKVGTLFCLFGIFCFVLFFYFGSFKSISYH